jgi:hypothetical protein
MFYDSYTGSEYANHNLIPSSILLESAKPQHTVRERYQLKLKPRLAGAGWHCDHHAQDAYHSCGQSSTLQGAWKGVRTDSTQIESNQLSLSPR